MIECTSIISINFSIPKGETTGVALDRVRAGLQAAGCEAPAIRFYLDEQGESRKVSPLARAIKKFPLLADYAFQCRNDFYADENHYNVFFAHNLDARWKIPPSPTPDGRIDWQTLVEIAQGIPKAYPFWNGEFIIEMPHWLEQQGVSVGGEIPARYWGDSYLGAYFFPQVCLSSRWGKTRRRILLSAMVPLSLPPVNARRMPPYHPNIETILGALGKPAGRSLVAMLNVEDKAEFDARNAEADQIINLVRSQPPLRLPLPSV